MTLDHTAPIVERAARAIAPTAFEHPRDEARCEEARATVIATLRALAQPTKGMIRAGCLWVRTPQAVERLRNLTGKDSAICKMRHRWQAMIDAALAPITDDDSCDERFVRYSDVEHDIGVATTNWALAEMRADEAESKLRAALSSPAPQDDVIVPRELLRRTLNDAESLYADAALYPDQAASDHTALRALLGAPTRG